MPPYGMRGGTTLEQPPDQSSRTPKGKMLSEFHFRGTAFDRSVALQWFNQAINRPRRIGIKINILSMYSLNDCKNCRTFAFQITLTNKIYFKMKKILIFAAMATALFFVSCNDDKDEQTETITGKPQQEESLLKVKKLKNIIVTVSSFEQKN